MDRKKSNHNHHQDNSVKLKFLLIVPSAITVTAEKFGAFFPD